MKNKRYKKSEEWLARALKSIPLGTQTFSKSKTQYPLGVSPYFVSHAKGSCLWDIDGNKYIDFVNSLASVTLGYCDPDVDKAVREQLKLGTIYSLPHKLEALVAEKIIEMVPCAEMVRFGKNGSDATAGAIRLARAYTNRDHVAVCGYHGWQDWYIGSTSLNQGVPKSTQELTHLFTYNDLDSLRKIFQDFPGQVAAVIMEPMNAVFPKDGFLEGVQELCRAMGALFVLDETITGFRFSEGGAQKLFGVTPDLATFGKGIANGYPLSALVGRAEIMKKMEELFFSFTFGGETLSLAASLATMTKLSKRPVIKNLKEKGQKLLNKLQKLIGRHKLENIFAVSGHPSWTFLSIRGTAELSQPVIKSLLLQEMFARGILTLGTHNLSYAHSDKDIDALLKAYDEIFQMITIGIERKDLTQFLHCTPIQPLFKVR